jgi:hypothetical protein
MLVSKSFKDKITVVINMTHLFYMNRKFLALFLLLVFCITPLSQVNSQIAKEEMSITGSEEVSSGYLNPNEISLPKVQPIKYVDEPIVSSPIMAPENIYSSGVENPEYITGDADGLTMSFSHAIEIIDYAVFRLNTSITSDSMILRNMVDVTAADSVIYVYGWTDPYSIPEFTHVNETYIDAGFRLLGMRDISVGDVLFEYENISLEYILLYDTCSFLGPTHSIDAIEIFGFTSFLTDEMKDGVPDIWEYPEMNMTQISESVDLDGTVFEIMSLVGTAMPGSTNLDFLLPFVKLGIIEETDIHEDHFYVVCQSELKLPFMTAFDYMLFLGSHDLLNMSYISITPGLLTDTLAAFNKFFGQDQRIRTWQVVDYTMESGNYDPMNYQATSNQISGKYDTLDVTTHTTTTAKEKFDLDASIVLDIVENVLDAVKGGKDLVTQFMSKIVGFIQGKMLDGIGKELLKKITKKALKTALKAILSITTIKDFVVKGIKILGKLGVPIPSWLQKILDFVESIPFIDPPVEIWKIRLTFLDDKTGVPILGYNHLADVPIYKHPQGIYFGDTYSAQVILSSRDIFPVVGRIQSKNASRVVTGHIYVEDLGAQDATHAKSSLEPNEHAEGRIYTLPPEDTFAISQCKIDLPLQFLPFVEADWTQTNILNFAITDENGTSLTDISKIRAAINNLPDTMIDLDIFTELSSPFSVRIGPSITSQLHFGVHMIAVLYKTDNMFHDYVNQTFVFQDTIEPTIEDVTAQIDETLNKVIFSAKIDDFGLNLSSIQIMLMKDTTSVALGTFYPMSSNGTHFVFDIALDDFRESVINYKIEASDNSGNKAITGQSSISIPKEAPGFTILTTLLPAIFISLWIVYRRRKVHY